MFLKLLFVHVFVDQEHIDYRDVKHKESPKHEVLEVPRHPEVALYLRGALTAHFVTQMSHLEHEVVEEGEGEGSWRGCQEVQAFSVPEEVGEPECEREEVCKRDRYHGGVQSEPSFDEHEEDSGQEAPEIDLCQD